MAGTMVIRGATLVDGTGAPARQADVAVEGARIVDVGPNLRGPREIDADGLHLLPGFVDIHTHYDAQVTWDPLVSPSSAHGVTTVVMGNCGVGFAPARDDEHDWLIGLMEGVEDIPGAALAEGLEWEWRSFPEYVDALGRKHRAVDFATQVPHGPVRAFVMGERGAADEPATEADRAAMARIVAEGTAAGALGFSTSRTPLHKARDGRYVPGTSAAEVELAEIAAALPPSAVLQLAVHHPDVPVELDWMERIAGTGVNVLFNLAQTDVAPELWRQVLDRVSQAPAPLRVQVAARPAGVLMNWQGSAHPFLPVMAYLELHQRPWEERKRALADPAVRAKIVGQDPMSIGPFEDMVVRSFHRMFRLGDPPDYEPSPDQSAAAVAVREGRSPREVVYDWLMEDDGRGTVYFPLFNYSYGHIDHMAEMITHPRAVVGLGDGGAHCGAICDASVPTWMLAYWVRDRSRGRLPLERVVEAHTRRTALAYGLADRGVVAPGYRADLQLVDLARVGPTAPRLAWDLPAGGRRWVQEARGVEQVWVAGVSTYERGVPTGALPGRLVRGPRPAPRPARTGVAARLAR